MDLMDMANDQQNLLEKVVSGLPGIKGYKQRELRREADKRVREMLAKQLQDQASRLNGIQVDLVAEGQLGLLDDMEKSSKKLQLLIDRIRTASYGYAPLFDMIKVEEPQLDALVEFDQNMAVGAERIKTIIDNLSTLGGRPEEEWKQSIRSLNTALDNLNTEFGHRNEVILQAAPAASSGDES